MRLDALKSRLGRKLSLLFLFAALVPLILVSSVVYVHTSNYIQSEREADLGKEAKLLETVIRERLLFLTSVIRSGKGNGADPVEDGRYFERIQNLPEDEVAGATERNFEYRRPYLNVSDAGQVAFTYLSDQASEPIRYFVLSEYLWGDLSVLSAEFDYCVFGNHKQTIFCNGDLSPRQHLLRQHLEQARSHEPVVLKDPDTGSRWLMVSREMYMGNRIAGDSWYVLTSLSRKEVFEPIVFFQKLFLGVFGLTLVVIVLLSHRQITRLMKPLRALSKGAEQIAKRQFSEPVDVQSDDEIEEVAVAFNHMSTRIAGHFQLLTALSELDRLILETHNVGRVSEIAWQRIAPLLQGACFCIVNRESLSSALAICHVGAPSAGRPESFTVDVAGCQENLIPFAKKPVTVSRAQLDRNTAPFAVALSRLDCFELYMIPVLVDDQWAGSVILGLGEHEAVDEDVRKLLDGLADRMAVSISASMKERALYNQAHYDYLTGLPNRKLLKDCLEQEIHQADEQQSKLAVVFADMDNFKQINDSLGHGVGDQFLIDVGKRLTAHLGAGNTVARQGGDEFIFLLPDIQSRSELPARMQSILDLFREPIFLEGHFIYASLSLGISIYPLDGRDLDQLLMHADTALYNAKSEGKSGFSMYDASMNVLALRRLELENALWNAIEKNELEYYYQPLINTQNGKIGFEALIRWDHPDKGVLSPEDFIPIAEETGLILEIGKRMFDPIFRQLNQWHQQESWELDKVAINISPLQLLAPDFIAGLQESLARHKIPVGLIELEITEGVFLKNQAQAEEKLRTLNRMGIALALDDFGTGYSSLSYLQRLPFDRIKIDKSFIIGIESVDEPPVLVTTIINMAQSMGLRITAEGVEQSFQYDMLKRLGCDVLQGYYIARPLPSDDCAVFARNFLESSIADDLADRSN